MNKNNTYYVVQLKNCGGASGKSTIRHFDNTTCDYRNCRRNYV